MIFQLPNGRYRVFLVQGDKRAHVADTDTEQEARTEWQKAHMQMNGGAMGTPPEITVAQIGDPDLVALAAVVGAESALMAGSNLQASQAGQPIPFTAGVFTRASQILHHELVKRGILDVQPQEQNDQQSAN